MLLSAREPIVPCPACKGERVVLGPTGVAACSPCNGSGLRAIRVRPPFKSCACGAAYDESAWRALPLVGVQHLDDGAPPLELRNCTACGSTIAIELPAIQGDGGAGFHLSKRSSEAESSKSTERKSTPASRSSDSHASSSGERSSESKIGPVGFRLPSRTLDSTT